MKHRRNEKEVRDLINLSQNENQSDPTKWITSNDLMVNINGNIFYSNENNEGLELLNLEDLADYLNHSELNFEPFLNSALDELLESDLASIPTFDTNNTLITQDIKRAMLKLVPKLDDCRDFNHYALESCLNNYWDIFHVQYPILHKPSFNTISTPPILLLAMTMMDACFSLSMEQTALQEPMKMATTIGEILRWIIFEYRSPGASDPWELQSLLILEVFEKHYSTRDFHERSSVHQSAKIEMMKRSTLLGGDSHATSSKSVTDLEAPTKDLLNRWIHAESMKRCPLMAFCFDLDSNIISGHQSTLYVNKLRLGLPCDDSIWVADMETIRKMELPKTPNLVISELKRLLKGEVIQTTSFGKRVMLSSLISLMIQFEQKDETTAMISDNYLLNTNILKNLWRDKISYALDAWKFNVNEGNCCDINNSLVGLNFRKNLLITKHFDLNDTKRKYPTYHMAQIRLRVVNHDMLTYASVLLRMSVTVDLSDYRNVEQRLLSWADSIDGRISVVHAYMCLIECLTNSEDKKIDYRPETDPIPERKHIVNGSLLIIWSYNFIKRGPESRCYNEKGPIYFKEDRFSYLYRIKKELDDEIMNKSSFEYHVSIKRCAMKLESIESLNSIAGLFDEVSKCYDRCFWVLGREYSRLLTHCKERLIGKEIFCLNMYDV